eukprot:GHVQ01007384.1.p1 GENE.GHVQ01007384.1~~GHVQ01007384.1.p1  ORF type:complete len:306 (-),score=31.51 GHVQ01007384.1:879-1796(-)
MDNSLEPAYKDTFFGGDWWEDLLQIHRPPKRVINTISRYAVFGVSQTGLHCVVITTAIFFILLLSLAGYYGLLSPTTVYQVYTRRQAERDRAKAALAAALAETGPDAKDCDFRAHQAKLKIELAESETLYQQAYKKIQEIVAHGTALYRGRTAPSEVASEVAASEVAASEVGASEVAASHAPPSQVGARQEQANRLPLRQVNAIAQSTWEDQRRSVFKRLEDVDNEDVDNEGGGSSPCAHRCRYRPMQGLSAKESEFIRRAARIKLARQRREQQQSPGAILSELQAKVARGEARRADNHRAWDLD